LDRGFFVVAGIPGILCYISQTNKDMNKQLVKMFEHSCPATEGDFENGCQTFEADQITLAINNDGYLHALKITLYERCFSRFTKEKHCYPNPYFKKEGIKKKYRYNILNSMFALNDISGVFYRSSTTKAMIQSGLKIVNNNADDKIEILQYTKKDVVNWLIRDFQNWLNDNKVQK